MIMLFNVTLCFDIIVTALILVKYVCVPLFNANNIYVRKINYCQIKL